MTTSSKLTLLGAIAFSAIGTTIAAESIYVPANSSEAGWGNYWAPGRYYYPSVNYFNTQNIGVYSGSAWVEASWGSAPGHNLGASYSFNGEAPVAINQTLLWNQVTAGSAGGSWSGFGGPGVGAYTLNGSSTLAMTNVNAISETRVTPLTGSILTHSSQAGLNPDWYNGIGDGAVGVSNPGLDGYRFAQGAENQYFYYAPNLTGTFDLDVSWGLGNPLGSTANWYLDPTGSGNVADYVSLLSFDTALFSDGIDRSTGVNGGTQIGQWSGFKSAGVVTLSSNSLIVYENPNAASLAGTVSDLQFTAVPEPSTLALLGIVAAGVVCRHRRRNKARLEA